MIRSRATTLALLIGIIFYAHAGAQGACELGEKQTFTLNCRTGRMTSPPRTERCMQVLPLGWYAFRLGNTWSRVTGGTGGEIRVSATPLTDPERLQATAALAALVLEAAEAGDLARVQGLSRSIMTLARDDLSRELRGEVTLRPYTGTPVGPPTPCIPGNSGSHCPHIVVDPIHVQAECLLPR